MEVMSDDQPTLRETERMARLPKWAQERIRCLERDVEDARNDMAEVHGKESRITFGYDRAYYDGAQKVPRGVHGKGFIPDGEHICFWINDRHYYQVSIGENRKLTVMSSTSFLLTEGRGCNSVELTARSQDIETDVPEQGDRDFG